jgi:hypothetical protein
MKAPYTPELQERCEARLNEIKEPEIQELREYAERRLLRIGLTTAGGRDLAQDALLAVIRGIESKNHGRRPTPNEVASKESFRHYLHGVILSMTDVRSIDIKSQRRCQTPMQDAGVSEAEGGVAIAARTIGTDEEAGWNDYKAQFFTLLRACTPERLQATIDAWEPVFMEADYIPVRFRKYAIELRPYAAAVVEVLGGLPQPTPRVRPPLKARPTEDRKAPREDPVVQV